MTRLRKTLTRRAESAGAAWRRSAENIGAVSRRLRRASSGVAATEFALILPMMLALYFGCVLLAQGLEAGRRTQQLSRTLADLTAGAPLGSNSTPVLTDTNFTNYFSAWKAVLYPVTTSPNMTISEIIFDNTSTTDSSCCVARVLWSVGSGPSPTLRQCGPLTKSANSMTTDPTQLPSGLYPTAVASGNTTDYYLIVVDVSNTYVPSFGFAPFAWNQTPNGGLGYLIKQTTYMAPRNSATSPVQWTSSGTISQTLTCTPNVP